MTTGCHNLDRRGGQLWLFILAPLVGGALAALAGHLFYPVDVEGPEVTAGEEPVVAH